jgi:hypothetical protein
MKAWWLLVAAVLLAGSGCGTTFDWTKVDHILPRESPRLVTARFQLALLDWNASDSYESLTEVSRGVIPYVIWKFIMPGQKHPELDIKIFDLLIDSKVEACYETGKKDEMGRPMAQVIAFHEGVNEGQTVLLFLEGEEWKVGLVETFSPGDAKEYIEEKLKEKEEKEKEPRSPDP